MARWVIAALVLVTVLTSCSPFTEKQEEEISNAEIIRQLQDVGLLEGKSHNQIDDDNPNAVVDLLVKSGDAIVVDRTLYENDVPDSYYSLFDLVKDTNEDVDFELVSLEVQEEERSWGPRKVVLVSIRQGGRTYTGELLYTERFKIASDYFRIINQALADASSNHRLFKYTIFCEAEDCDTNFYYGQLPVDPNRFGIISLTQDQAEAVAQNRLLPICCREFDLLTTDYIKALLEGYEETGLLDGMSESEIESAKTEILSGMHYHPNGLIYSFESLTYSFDTETANFDNPYEEVTVGLAGISRGQFHPQSIMDNYEYDKLSVFSFELNGTKYETTLQNNGDWLDLSVVGLINQALEEQQIDGQFYALDDEGQFVTLIFLPENRFEAVMEAQLLTLIDIAESTAVEDGQDFEQKVREQLNENK
jgi:hypothetical protein